MSPITLSVHVLLIDLPGWNALGRLSLIRLSVFLYVYLLTPGRVAAMVYLAGPGSGQRTETDSFCYPEPCRQPPARARDGCYAPKGGPRPGKRLGHRNRR